MLLLRKIGDSKVIFSDTLQVDYEDITSIANIYNLGFNTGRDYKFVRTELMTAVWTKMQMNPANWVLLDNEEKLAAVKMFVVPAELRNTIMTLERQIIYSKQWGLNSIKCREERFNDAIFEVYNRVSLENANIIGFQLKNSVSTTNKDLKTSYIEQGVEGTLVGDPEGIFDYLNNTIGTSFENAGFRSFDWLPIGYNNMTELSLTLLNILQNGKYSN